MPSDMGAVPGRSCAGCSLCCTLLSVAELDKPPMTGCEHCGASGGCGIYQERPTECRQFYCGYRLDLRLDGRWKPSTCGFLVAFDEPPYAVAIHVEAGAFDAWRAEPYHSQIRQWARMAAARNVQVVVWQGDDKIIVSPGFRPEATAATPV